MEKLENIRNNFTKTRGGKLISVESFILAVVVFAILTAVKDISPYISLVVAFVVGFVFPILVGVFKPLAWLAATVFSLFWGLLGGCIASVIARNSFFVGLLVAVIVFVVSFRVHKNYSGLLFQGISQKGNENIDLAGNNGVTEEVIQFCPECGRRITSQDGVCRICNR